MVQARREQDDARNVSEILASLDERELERAMVNREEPLHERLDLGATLQATICAGGLPRLVYRRGSRVPEYLVLIDCASPRDHLAAFFDQLAAALEREGVFIVRSRAASGKGMW